MAQKKKKLMVLCGAVLIVVIVLGFQLRATFSAGGSEAGATLLSDKVGNEVGNTYLKLFREYKQSSLILDRDRSVASNTSIVERNPFVVPMADRPKPQSKVPAYGPPVQKSAPRENLKLSGILWDEKAPSAVINNKVVQTGNRIGAYRVVMILQDRVIVSNNQRRMTLRLPKTKTSLK